MMSPLYNLRAAVPSDAPRLCAFAASAFSTTFGACYKPADLESHLSSSYTPAIVAGWMSNPRMSLWIAESIRGDGADTAAILGYSLAGPVQVPAADAAPHDGELRKLYVSEAAKGHGVAQALLAPCVEWVRAGRCAPSPLPSPLPDGLLPPRLYIGVWSENARAIAFYRKAGAEVVGRYEYIVGEARDLEFIMRM